MTNVSRGTMTRAPRAAAVLCAAVFCALVVMLISPPGLADATPRQAPRCALQWATAEEAAFVAKINDLRSSKGLSTLTVDAQLNDQSRRWAAQLCENGGLSHAPDLSTGISADWGLLGENVGLGGDVQSVFDAFVASPSHYKNLVDPTYQFVGVGVLWHPDGRLFTTHRFMALRSAKPKPAPAPKPAPRPKPAPIPDSIEMPEPTAPPTTVAVAPAATPERATLVINALGPFFDD